MRTPVSVFAAELAADLAATRPGCVVRWGGIPCGAPGAPASLRCPDPDCLGAVSARWVICPRCAALFAYAGCLDCLHAGRIVRRMILTTEVG